MEPVMFMPATLAGHMAKHCNHMVNSPDENNNIGGVYKGNFTVSSQIIRRLSAIVFYVHFLKTWENRVHSLQPLNKFEKPIWIKYLHCKSCKVVKIG